MFFLTKFNPHSEQNVFPAPPRHQSNPLLFPQTARFTVLLFACRQGTLKGCHHTVRYIITEHDSKVPLEL